MKHEVDPAASEEGSGLCILVSVGGGGASEGSVAAGEVDMAVSRAVGSTFGPDVPVAGGLTTVTVDPVVALVESGLVGELRVEARGLEVYTAAARWDEDVSDGRLAMDRQGYDRARGWGA